MTNEEIQEYCRKIGEAIEDWMAQVMPLFTPLWQNICAWIERQGILSPALAYASPNMRRRAARQRAHIAMQAKNRQRAR